LWLSAIQLQTGDQVSLGAVSDGYPMLPVLDPNDDGRFTIRELRGITKALEQFDVDGDGQIQKEELRPTIRVSFGLGATVHQALAGVRRVHPAGAPPKTGPEWFVRMDRNKDHDLTRQEFPGTDEQFQQLDADKDDLVSSEEALEFDRLTSPPASSETETETKPPNEPPAVNDN
jgi:Ca2+-binding EF-hand superfamily protein